MLEVQKNPQMGLCGPQFSPGYTRFRQISPGFAGIYLVLPVFDIKHLDSPGFAGIYLVLPVFDIKHLDSPGFAGIYLVLPVVDIKHLDSPGFAGIYLVLPVVDIKHLDSTGFAGIYLVLPVVDIKQFQVSIITSLGSSEFPLNAAAELPAFVYVRLVSTSEYHYVVGSVCWFYLDYVPSTAPADGALVLCQEEAYPGTGELSSS